MAKPPLVHFTHHLCLVADPKTNPYERMHVENEDKLDHRDSYEHLFGGHTREPNRKGILMHCRGPLRYRKAFSMSARKVTCEGCKLGIIAHKERAWLDDHNEVRPTGWRTTEHSRMYTWVDDRTLTLRAWYLCCRHVGIACPHGFDAEDVIRKLDAFALATRTKNALGWFATGIGMLGDAPHHREWLEKAVTELDASVRELVEPVIHELTMIGDVLEEIDRMRARARECFNAALATIHPPATQEGAAA